MPRATEAGPSVSECRPLSNVRETVESHLESLTLVVDSKSLNTFFQTFSFPHLKSASILIPENLVTEDLAPVVSLGDFHLPTLKNVKFSDLSRRPSAFLNSCIIPNLASLYLSVRHSWRGLGISKLRLGSPKRLTVFVGFDDSLEGKFEPFDLSEMEAIELFADPIHFQDELANRPLGSHRRLHLPKLKDIALNGAGSFVDAIRWLHSRFLVPTTLELLSIDWNCQFSSVHTVEADTSITFEVKSLALHHRNHDFSSFSILDWDLDSPMNSHIYSGSAYYVLSISTLAEAFKPEDSTHPAFCHLESLIIQIYHQPGDFDAGWVNFLASGVRLTDDQGREAIPFPGLVELKVRCDIEMPPNIYAIVREKCREIVSVRKAAGFPIRTVKMYRTKGWTAEMGYVYKGHGLDEVMVDFITTGDD